MNFIVQFRIAKQRLVCLVWFVSLYKKLLDDVHVAFIERMYSIACDPLIDVGSAADLQQRMQLRTFDVCFEELRQFMALVFRTSHPWNEMDANHRAVEGEFLEVIQEVGETIWLDSLVVLGALQNFRQRLH